MIMKKQKNSYLFKIFTFFLITYSPFIISQTSNQSSLPEGMEYNEQTPRADNTSKPVEELTNVQRQLRDELISAGIIVDKTQGQGGQRLYIFNEGSAFMEVFKTECPTGFSEKLDSFVTEINEFFRCQASARGSCSVNYNDNIPEEIDSSIRNCMETIRDKRKELIKSFTIPILKNYDNLSLDENVRWYLKKQSSFSKIISPSDQSKNYYDIQNEIKEYMEFEEQCLIKGIAEKIDCFYMNTPIHRCKDVSKINSFKAFSDDWTSQNCKDRFKRFNDFANGDLFKKFIALAETDCKDEDSLKASSNSACKKTVGWLKPEYPDEDNELNLFQQCQIEIDKAYKECFGEQGKRTDLQELLYLIDQKSPAVCDNNRISRARPALQNCLNAVNKCSKACNNQITAFKEDFLQCFFLPNFKEADKEPNSMIVHKNTPCKNRITDLKKSFKTQSKAEPFKIKQPSFRNLALQGSQSLVYQIAKACEKPLDERQLEKKQAEMIQVCRMQNPNSRQPLIAPAVGVNPSSNNNSTGAKSSSGDNSRSFSYGGSNNNQGSNFNNNLPQDEKQGPENSPFSYDGPTDDPSNTSKNKKDTNSVSANFDNKHEDSTGSLSPLSLSDSSSSSKRKTASQGSLTGAEDSSKEEIEGKSEESIMDKADTVIRNYLSSDEQYGIIDEDPQPQSTTQRFFNWMNDKKRKTKKALLKAYDGVVGIDREEFKRRLHLNSEHVNLFELQRDLLIKACEIHNCDGRGASPEIQSQIQQQHRQNQQRKPSAQ